MQIYAPRPFQVTRPSISTSIRFEANPPQADVYTPVAPSQKREFIRYPGVEATDFRWKDSLSGLNDTALMELLQREMKSMARFFQIPEEALPSICFGNKKDFVSGPAAFYINLGHKVVMNPEGIRQGGYLYLWDTLTHEMTHGVNNYYSYVQPAEKRTEAINQALLKHIRDGEAIRTFATPNYLTLPVPNIIGTDRADLVRQFEILLKTPEVIALEKSYDALYRKFTYPVDEKNLPDSTAIEKAQQALQQKLEVVAAEFMEKHPHLEMKAPNNPDFKTEVHPLQLALYFYHYMNRNAMAKGLGTLYQVEPAIIQEGQKVCYPSMASDTEARLKNTLSLADSSLAATGEGNILGFMSFDQKLTYSFNNEELQARRRANEYKIAKIRVFADTQPQDDIGFWQHTSKMLRAIQSELEIDRLGQDFVQARRDAFLEPTNPKHLEKQETLLKLIQWKLPSCESNMYRECFGSLTAAALRQ